MDMDAKQKTSTKVLSLVLSLLLAVSCFSIALPVVLPGASAAASTAEWNALATAFANAKSAGIMSSSAYTNAGSVSSNGTTITIEDTTSKSYLWNIVVALRTVMANERASYTTNASLLSRIQGYSSLGLNTYQKAFVAAIIKTDGNVAYTSSNKKNAGTQTNENVGGSGDYPAEPSNTMSTFSYSYTLTRTLKSAVLAECTSVPASNKTFNTKMTFTMTETYQNQVTHTSSAWSSSYKDGTNTKSTTRYRTTSTKYEWFYCSAISGASYTTASIGTTLVPITNYNSYVGNSYFANGYSQYVADNNAVYNFSTDYLNTIYDAYLPYYNAVASIDKDYLDAFISGGQAKVNSHLAYTKACKGAYNAALLKDYVTWIQTDDFHVVASDIAHNDFAPSLTDKAAYDHICALLTQTNAYYKKITDSTTETQSALASVYGYSASEYVDLINELTDAKQQYELYQLKLLIDFRISHTHDENNGDTAIYGVTDYESYLYEPKVYYTDENGVEVIDKTNWPMSDTLVKTASSWFNGKYSAIMNYKSNNIAAVFGDATASYVKTWRDNLQVEVDYRNAQDTYYNSYYEVIEPIINGGIDYTTKTTKSIEDLIANLEAKLNSMNAAINTATSKVGSTKVGQIYGTGSSYYPTVVQNAINSYYIILWNRCYDDVYDMVYKAHDEDDNTPGDEINLTNMSAVKRAIRDIDEDLYTYVTSTKSGKYNSLVGSAMLNKVKTWHGWIETYNNKIAEVMAQKWDQWSQIKLDNGTGTYTTRYVDQYGNDMVRDDPNLDGSDKYVVTEAKINTVVTKLDTFVNSADFTKLIGVYDEEAGITSLGKFIDNMLTEMLFTDDMVNTVIALLLPMICDLLDTKIDDLIKNLEIDGTKVTTDPPSGWSARLKAYELIVAANGSNEFSASGATVTINSGYVDIAYNGLQGTNTFPVEFATLGLYIYPSYFGSKLPSSVNGVSLSTFKSNLSKAGSNWHYFDDPESDVDPDTGKRSVTKLSLADKGAQWGCKDYNTFCTALATVFSCIEPLVKCLFTNYTFNASTTTKFLYAHADIDGRAKYSFVSGDVDLEAKGYGYATLTLNGIQGYNNLWAPIMEALGISATTSSKDVSNSTPLSTSLGNAGNDCSVTQIVKGLIQPIYTLINRLDTAPVSTLCSILPDVAMAVATDMVQPLLDTLALNIGLKATIEITDFNEITLWGWFGLTWLGNILKGTINDKLKDVVDTTIPLDLGDMLGDMLTEEKLGMDITDLNSIANFLFDKLFSSEEETDDRAISLPAINSGELAKLGYKQELSSIRTANYNCSLGSGRRLYIKARQSDVLYHFVLWVLDFIAVDGNLNGLLVTLGQKPLDDTITSIVNGITNGEGALAALVELFVPQDYAFEDYDWYQSNSSASTFNFGSSADFVYTMYGNDWTLDKAEYMYDELETVVNSIFDMVDTDIFGDIGVTGINELAQYYINSMFNNKGIMNVVKLVTGIGESLADSEFIVKFVKEQLQSNGASANVDLLAWYNTFGYLTYDYDQLTDPELTAEEREELAALAPKKPNEAGYINNFPLLSVQTEIATDEEGATIYDDDGNITYNYIWSYRTSTSAAWQTLEDNEANAREIFMHIFCELVRPFSPLLDLILTGSDLSLFAGAIVINGYESYEGAIIPALETLGIKNLKTQAQYTAYSKANGSAAAFDYLVNVLFDYVTDLLTIEADGTGPVQKIINLLPRVFYFLQSDGLTTLIKNLLHPVWCLIDTVRPLVNADLDGIVHKVLCGFLGLTYDAEDTINYPSSPIADLIYDLLAEKFEVPEYNAAQAAEDKPYVDTIYLFTVEDLSLKAIRELLMACFGIDLTPAIYAFEGMCVGNTRNGVTYGVKAYASKGDTDETWQKKINGNSWYELDYYGPDTITVTICAVLDLIRYGDNEQALDKMIGLVRDASEESGNNRVTLSENFTASGLLEALSMLFEDAPVALTGDSPNWDYFLEGKSVQISDDGNHAFYEDVTNGNYAALAYYTTVDISEYHSLYQLSYVTDWTPDIADNIDVLLSDSLDYIISLIDANKGGATTLAEFVNNLLMENLFTGDILKKLADLIGKIYDIVPDSVVDVVDNLLDINITAWKQYVKKQLVVDEEGNPVLDDDGEEQYAYQADPDHPWWSDPEAAEYVDTDEEFYAAINELLQACAPLFGLIFLGDDYRLFRTMGNGVGSEHYGDDAIVLNGLNAYSRGLIPILEALGCDLTGYEPSKYVIGTDANGNSIYDNELFVSDLFDIVKALVDNILDDPYEYIIDNLANVVYFTNANGWSTALTNILGAVYGILDTVNLMLDEDKQINYETLTELLDLEVSFDLRNLTLDAIFGLIEGLTGIYVRDDLIQFIKTLYVGVLENYTSANGLGAYRMNLNKTYLDPATGRYKEGRGDFITILVSLIVEILTDSGSFTNDEGELVTYDNPAAIDALIQGDSEEPASIQVSTIIGLLKNPTDPTYKAINWDYFDESLNLSDSTDNVINIKPYQFLYLNYTTDWTEAKAEDVVGKFDDLLLAALKMLGDEYADATSASEIIKSMLNLDSFYTAETLQNLLDLIQPLLYGEDAVLNKALLNLAGALLGADLTEWDYKYAFGAKVEGETYTTDTEAGLDYAMITTDVLDEEGNPTGETKTMKTYAIEDRDDFIAGITLVLKPAYRLLSWILFGDDYDFFISNTDATLESRLLTIKGAKGYKYGLSLLLEALGIDDELKTEENYLIGYDAVSGSFTGVDMASFVDDVLQSLCARMDEIIANPVTEVEGLISELIYFINAGGLQVSIQNLAECVLNLLDAVTDLGLVDLDIDSLLNGLINKAINKDVEEGEEGYIDVNFTLDGINLEYIFTIAEAFTGLKINEVVGNTLEYFKIGQVYPYASASGMLAYKMRFNSDESFADFVTVLLSFVIDIFEYEGNAEALGELIGVDPALLGAIATFLRESYTVTMKPIDWFYFDSAYARYDDAGALKDPQPTFDASTVLSVSENTINYFTYASNWTKDSADAIYQNRNELIASVLGLLGVDADNLGDLIASKLDLNEVLYTQENLQKILDLVKGLTTSLDASIKEILNIVIDVDLSAYDTMEITEVNGRTDFVGQLNDILQPISRVLDWLLFDRDIQYFDKKNYEDDSIKVLINLPGANGYANALIPILEALGVTLPDINAGDSTEDILYVLINNVLARVENILANPVDEVLDLLPNLIYFVNTNALSTCVNNLLAPVVALLDEIGPTVGIGTVDELISSLLKDSDITIDINKLDWMAIITIVEELTGLEITDVVTAEKIDNFYFGEMTAYQSANGETAFRMAYCETQGPADMLTFILNFVIEVLVYEDEANGIDNAKKVDELVGTEGIVDSVVAILTEGKPIDDSAYIEPDWNYFTGDSTVTLGAVNVPTSAFVYLDYSNDWTYDKAAKLTAGLTGIVNDVLVLAGSDKATVQELLAGLLPLDDYLTAENLNKLLELISGALYGEDSIISDALATVINVVLGTDLTAWKDKYTFVASDAVTSSYVLDAATGLKAKTEAGKTYYAIESREDFVNGLCLILEPAENILAWLLLGQSYGFFVDSETGAKTLLNLYGGDGYTTAITLLLEALGCKNLPTVDTADLANADMGEILKGVMNSVLARVDEIMADPINEVIDLIPEILYFINAHGLHAVVKNLTAGLVVLLDNLEPITGFSMNIDELLTGLIKQVYEGQGKTLADDFTFSTADIDLPYILKVVKDLTDIDVAGALGTAYGLEKFVVGNVVSYTTSSRFTAYKTQLAALGDGTDAERDRADVITIALSLALDVVMYKNDAEGVDNAATIEALAGLEAGTIDAIIALLKAHTTETQQINWFYFDPTVDVSTIDASTTITMPERTIEYIEYKTDWTEDTADYFDANLDSLITAVLKLTGSEETVVAAIIEKYFTLDELYTADLLNKISGAVAGLISSLGDSIVEVAGVLLGCDIASYKTMTFTDEEIVDRATFEAGLCEVLAPIYNVLDWFLFGDPIEVFYNNEAYGDVNADGTAGYDILSVSGYEGYAYGLAPILEALGVALPTYVSGTSTAADIVPGVVTGLLDFAEKVLADPVNEVLAIVPNVLYFINANGLSASIQNLIGALTCMLADVKVALDKFGVDLGDYDLTSVQALVDSVLESALKGTDYEGKIAIDLDNVTLGAVCDIVTNITGIALRDVVVENGFENFYLGQVEYFESSTGNAAFRMVYTEEEGRAELLTILINFLVDVAMYQDAAKGIDNPAAIDALVGTDGTVAKVVSLIKKLAGDDVSIADVDWNYFGGTVDGTYLAAGSTINPPATPFNNYLAYTSDWSKDTANYLYANIATMADQILTMTKGETVADLLSGVNLYQGKFLNTVVEAIQKLYDVIPEELIPAIDAVVGTDINGWRDLSYEDRDMTAAEFVAALEEILEPAYPILDWLLFGDNLEYFVQDKSGETLIKVKGNQGYAAGLAVILEALGVDLPEYNFLTDEASCETMMKPVLTAVTVRIAEIFNNPVDEVLELLPNLLYYINTNGISVAVNNLLASVINVLPEISEMIGKDITVANVLKELAGIDLSLENLDLTGILTFVEGLDALKGLKVVEVFTGDVTDNGDGTFTFTQNPAGDTNLLENFYLGNAAQYKSSTGYAMYKMNYTAENKGDLLTMLLSIVLQVAIYEDNAAPLAALINNEKVTEDTILALVQILTSDAVVETSDINWTYYLGLTDKDEIDAYIQTLATNTTTAIDGIKVTRTANYLKYTNNWNEETASYLINNLPEIVDLVINMVTDGETADLAALLQTVEIKGIKIGELYSDDTVNKLITLIADALNGLIEKLGGTEIFDAAGKLLSVDILAVKNYKASGVKDKATFAAALAEAFAPLGEILDWILFGRDYEFFTKLSDGTNSIIKLNGGEGFKYGLAPVLEALGADTHIEALVAAASNDKSITEQVLATVLENVCDVIDNILADPVNEVLALVPEILYFINANGAQVCVDNVLAPVDTLLAEVAEAIGNDDISSIAKIAKVDILANLNLAGICDLVKTKTGIDVYGAVGAYLSNFYFGQLTHYTSYDGVDGFRMEYSATEEAHDFVTILLTVVLDVASYEGNAEFFINLLDDKAVKEEDKDAEQTKAKQMYYSILALLTGDEAEVEMQDFDWLFVTKAPLHPEWVDSKIAVSPLMTDSEFDYLYGPLFKREMGEYITKWLPEFMDTMIVLLGIEGADGNVYQGLDSLLEGLIGNSVYTNDLLYKLLDALQNIYPMLEDKIGAELTAHIAEVLDDCLGVDLRYWNDYTVNTITEGDRNAFVDEVVRMLRPAYPILKWLLIEGEDLAFFTEGENGTDYITLKSADGYAYSIVPILEALHCEGIVAPAAYKADAEADMDNMLYDILNPLLDKVDAVLADPTTEILDVATSAIYFLNSNAADTCFKNVLNAVYRLLKTIEPVTGEINVYELIGMDLAELNIESLIDELLTSLEEKYGFQLTKPAVEAIKELTMGYLYSFTSLNGRQAYSMEYATGADQTDLVTVVLRFAMVFISEPDNVVAIEAMIKPKLSEEGYKFVCALLDNFATMSGTSEGMDTIMYTIYYIFYAANVAAHEVENGLAEFNGNYSFMDQLFATSDVAFFRQLEKSFGDLLHKYTDPVINEEGVMTDGAIPFFKRIMQWFQKLMAFFQSLFK